MKEFLGFSLTLLGRISLAFCAARCKWHIMFGQVNVNREQKWKDVALDAPSWSCDTIVPSTSGNSRKRRVTLVAGAECFVELAWIEEERWISGTLTLVTSLGGLLHTDENHNRTSQYWKKRRKLFSCSAICYIGMTLAIGLVVKCVYISTKGNVAKVMRCLNRS